MRKILFLLLTFILFINMQSCSYQKNPDSKQTIEVKKEIKPAQTTVECNITIEEIVDKYLPHPFSPVVHIDSLEFKGKWMGNVIPGLTQEMEKLDWKKYDVMGAIRFYKKEINEQEIKISILPIEKGGPEEKDAITFVMVELEQ